ncbi:MAG TPA: GNAT family N-acetyltransferase [Nocardioidaceae bacterium]|nr:GNAT family N-acetyltransferase [Nocardioidaceae bacterium]
MLGFAAIASDLRIRQPDDEASLKDWRHVHNEIIPTHLLSLDDVREHRRQGFGEELYARGLDRARELGAKVIVTVVLSSNEDGLRFAHKHGFVEVERYVLPGGVRFLDRPAPDLD